MRGELGQTLLRLIRERYGTQRRFATTANLSYGWVSQLVNGTQPNVGFPALERLFGAFAAAEQEALYRAWLSDFAPSPLERLTPTGRSSDEEILTYCQSTPALIQDGCLLGVWRTTRSLWRELRGQEERFRCATACAVEYAEACYALQRRSEGVAAIDELRRWAQACGEPAVAAQARWLLLTGSRFLYDPRSRLLRQCQTDLLQYLDAWQPRGRDSVSQRRDLLHGARRDNVLYLLDLCHVDDQARPLLGQALTTLTASYDAFGDPRDITLCREIEARVEVFAGRLDAAHQALTFARKSVQPVHAAHPIKVDLTLARLFIADRQFDRAEAVLDRAKSGCEELRLLHYGGQVAELLHLIARL